MYDNQTPLQVDSVSEDIYAGTVVVKEKIHLQKQGNDKH